MVRGKDAVKAGEVDARARYERGQATDEIERLEEDGVVPSR